MSAAVWIVGSPGFVQRAARDAAEAWASHRLEPIALPWSRRVDAGVAGAAEAALAAGDVDLVMLTSAESVAALPAGAGAGHRAACVGVATAAAARAKGFDVADDVDVAGVVRGGRALGAAIAAREPRPRRVLWLCGRDRRHEPREVLAAAGIALDEVVTYALDARPDFAETLAAAPRPAAVVLGSPRGVDALAATLVGLHRALDQHTPVIVPRGEVTERHARDAFGARVRVAPPRGDGRGTDYPRAVAEALGSRPASDDEVTPA